MSVSATTVNRLPRHRRPSAQESVAFRAIAWITVGIDLVALGVATRAAPESVPEAGLDLIWWVALVALVGLAPIPSGRGPVMVMDLPLLLAAGFVHGPLVAGLVALVGCWDVRELRREISLSRSLWNRAQTSLSSMAAAAVFLSLGGHLGSWPRAVGAAVLAVAADIAVNYLCVALGYALPKKRSLLRVVADMRLGPIGVFAPAYASFGFLGLLLAEVHERVGPVGLLAFAAPILLAYQAFSQRRALDVAEEELEYRDRALVESAQRVADERRDERRQIATALHDDVVQSLHYVTLYASVIRENLRSGRLLELDDDLPALLRASQMAADGLRGAISGLRESPLGRDGLESTLELLAREMNDETDVRIIRDIRPVDAPPDVQLAIYQIAREAILNSVKHSKANVVRLELTRHGDLAVVVISDDGLGFAVDEGEPPNHFGLALMRERARLSRGSIRIESQPGSGTRVEASFPLA